MSDKPRDLNLRPFTVLMGILLGTVFSIAFGLAIVCLVFWILKDEEPRLLTEFDSLLVSTSIFVMLTVFAAAAFLGSLHRSAWRHAPMLALWAGLFLAGRYYWPE